MSSLSKAITSPGMTRLATHCVPATFSVTSKGWSGEKSDREHAVAVSGSSHIGTLNA
jgi:hypothetical protein